MPLGGQERVAWFDCTFTCTGLHAFSILQHQQTLMSLLSAGCGGEVACRPDGC